MKQFTCGVCGFVYDEHHGLPGEAIPPVTLWADIPDTWVCPDCGAGRERFVEQVLDESKQPH